MIILEHGDKLLLLENKQQHLDNELNKTQQTKTIDVGYAKEDLLYNITFDLVHHESKKI